MDSIPVKTPENLKKQGLCYAVSDDGIELPVVDITRKEFALTMSAEALAVIAEKSIQGLEQSMRIPAFLRKMIARRSILMRTTMEASGTVLSGMGTYLFKIGPGNLGNGYAGRLDRKIASSITPVCVRLRLQAMARLMCDALVPRLAMDKRQPVHLVNIGGGTSLDSLNALILIRKEYPEVLTGRPIHIHVLDRDQAGPHFGIRALSALRAGDGPLHGLDMCMNHVGYEWKETATLRTFLESIDARSAIVIGSSEGGLFEYGTDQEIVSNLEALHNATGDDFVMVGSIVRDDRIPKKIQSMGRLTLRTIGLDAFRSLAGHAGWMVSHTIEGNPLYHVAALIRTSA